MQVKASREASSPQRARSPPIERLDMITNNIKQTSLQESSQRIPIREEGAHSPSSPVPQNGKYSFMQFALQNFRLLAE